MLAALAILCLVIDRGTVDLNFSGAVVALEVRHVIHRVPQAEFHIREEGYAARGSVLVGHADLQDLTVVADRDKCSDLGRDLILFAVEDGVTDSVTGLIIVERCLGRLPSRIPDRIAVLNIEVMAVAVLRRVVVAESCKTEKLGVFIEAVPAAGVRDHGEEFFASEVVDPGKRRFRGRDHIFFVLVIKITVFHKGTPFHKNRKKADAVSNDKYKVEIRKMQGNFRFRKGLSGVFQKHFRAGFVIFETDAFFDIVNMPQKTV